MGSDQSLKDMEIISDALSALGVKHAFVGGATVAVHLSSTGILESRPTDDVDCVIDPPSLPAYYQLEERLRKSGFVNEIKGPRCRWNFKGIVVDIMPANEKISGMRGRWFKEGFENSKTQALPNGKNLQIFSAPYLLATKFDAFIDRGKNDLRMSTDIEDIIILLDGCPNLFEEIRTTDGAVKKYLLSEFKTLLNNDEFEEVVYGQIAGAERDKKAARILDQIKLLIQR